MAKRSISGLPDRTCPSGRDWLELHLHAHGQQGRPPRRCRHVSRPWPGSPFLGHHGPRRMVVPRHPPRHSSRHRPHHGPPCYPRWVCLLPLLPHHPRHRRYRKGSVVQALLLHLGGVADTVCHLCLFIQRPALVRSSQIHLGFAHHLQHAVLLCPHLPLLALPHRRVVRGRYGRRGTSRVQGRRPHGVHRRVLRRAPCRAVRWNTTSKSLISSPPQPSGINHTSHTTLLGHCSVHCAPLLYERCLLPSRPWIPSTRYQGCSNSSSSSSCGAEMVGATGHATSSPSGLNVTSSSSASSCALLGVGPSTGVKGSALDAFGRSSCGGVSGFGVVSSDLGRAVTGLLSCVSWMSVD
mmetsp:Transcript_51171/g.111254  ORF Transcript_51171/g.111254 Transcript_51171/m.111254 type:complete len:352 (+) Transcript_51171:672-1727(+)